MLLLLASYRPKNPMRSGSLVGLRPKPWWRGPVTPGNPAAHPDDPAVDSGTDGVVHLTVELWEGVSVDDGGLLKITKGGRVHNVTDDVPGHRRGRVVRLRVRNREVGQSMIAREKPHERRKEGPRDEGARERVAPGGAGSRRFARELEPPPPERHETVSRGSRKSSADHPGPASATAHPFLPAAPPAPRSPRATPQTQRTRVSYLFTALSFGTRQPDVSHLTRLTCPLAPAGLFLPECLLFFTIAAVLALRLMRLRLLPSSALPWRSPSLGAKSRGGGWGDRACSVKISVYRSHIALDFSNLPPHKGLAAPRAETRTARPEIYTRGTRNSFFFGFPQGGGQRCIERAPGTDQSTHLEDTMAGEKIR